VVVITIFCNPGAEEYSNAIWRPTLPPHGGRVPDEEGRVRGELPSQTYSEYKGMAKGITLL